MSLLREELFSQSWPTKPLGEVVEFLDNLRKPVKSSDRIEGDYNYYGANGLQGTINDFLFEEPLVLLAEDGGHFGNPERDIAYIAEGKYWVNNHAHVLKPCEGLDLRFLYRVLQKYDVSKYIKGATRAKLTKGDAAVMPIPLPPLTEQKRIAAILDKADAIRRKRQQAIKLADEFLRSVFLDMFGDPVTNPKGWEVKSIEEIADKRKYSIKAGPFGSALKKQDYVESGYKIYGQEQVIRDDLEYGNYYIDEQKYLTLKSCAISEGDMLISLVGSFGKISVVPKFYQPGIINPRLMKVHFDAKYADPWFMKYLLTTNEMIRKIENMSHGGTMGILNVGKVKDLEVIVPPVEIQRIFLGIFNRIESLKKKLIEISDFQLFESLNQKAFRGEL